MSDNPFQSPQSNDTAVGVLSGSMEDLRAVAFYQRGVIFCILGYFVAIAAQFALPAELVFLLGLGVLAVVLAGAVFVFLLAIKVYGVGLGILFGILTLIPLIGLVVLLIINGKATKVLRQNGIKVGLLGAKV